MTIMEYAQEIANKVGGTVQEVEKANGIVMTGIAVGDGAIKRVIYINDMYNGNISVDEAISEIKEVEERSKDVTFNIQQLYDWDNVKGMLRARLYNLSTKAEVFCSAYNRGFNDLIIIPYIELGDNASVKVTKVMVEAWGVTEEDVINNSIKNIEDDAVLSSLAEVLGGPEEMGGDVPMYVVRNKELRFGASAILSKTIYRQLKEKFPNGYIVLPSSVHEVIVVDKDFADMGASTDMVKEVNSGYVAPEDRLSDRVYEF